MREWWNVSITFASVSHFTHDITLSVPIKPTTCDANCGRNDKTLINPPELVHQRQYFKRALVFCGWSGPNQDQYWSR